MTIKSFSQHPRIASSDLSRLTLDSVSALRYERRFRFAVLPGMLLVFTSLLTGHYLYHAGILSENRCGAVGFAGGALGLVLAIVGFRRVLSQRPLSAQSHRAMSAFVIRDRQRNDAVEVAYIDETSGTYFTRLYSTPST